MVAVAEFWALINPRDACMLGAAFLARCVFVPLLDASLASEVMHLLSSMSCTSRREAEKKRLLGPSEHKRSSHRTALRWLFASHEWVPDLLYLVSVLCSLLSFSIFSNVFSLLRFGIVPGRVRTHPEDRQCWFLVYFLFSCSPLLYLFADALFSGGRRKSTFYFVSKRRAFWVRHWVFWAQQTLSKLHSNLYYDVICHEVTDVAAFLSTVGKFLRQLKKRMWRCGNYLIGCNALHPQ